MKFDKSASHAEAVEGFDDAPGTSLSLSDGRRGQVRINDLGGLPPGNLTLRSKGLAYEDHGLLIISVSVMLTDRCCERVRSIVIQGQRGGGT